MWLEDIKPHNEANKWTDCYNCKYWLWYCSDAVYGIICNDYRSSYRDIKKQEDIKKEIKRLEKIFLPSKQN